jgi:hypothetical protein
MSCCARTYSCANACTHALSPAGGVHGLDRIDVLCGRVVARELLSDLSPSLLLQVAIHDSIIVRAGTSAQACLFL